LRAGAERGSEIPRATPEGAFNGTLFIHALQANGPLTVRQPLRCHAARLGRCIDVHRTMPSVIPHVRVGAARPKKRIFVIAITSRVQSAALVLCALIVNVTFDGSS
jgi:hypothetical protein